MFPGTYKEFYSRVEFDKNEEEKFDNILIDEDGSIASVSFDYSFWSAGKMENWGSEHWQLIKNNGRWQITSVTFSMELTKYFPQPSLKERKAKRKLRIL